jgi:hypothetical protein
MARRNNLDPDEVLDPDELQEKLEEEGAFDARGILKDGCSTSVKLYMRDGAINPNLTAAQRGKAMQHEDAAARRFGLSDGLQLHKPGFRYNTDAAAIERTSQAYADADTEAANAWKGRATGPVTAPVRPDVAALVDARAEAYRLCDEEQQNAWRGNNR